MFAYFAISILTAVALWLRSKKTRLTPRIPGGGATFITIDRRRATSPYGFNSTPNFG
jgi:hypothetical protein